MEIKDAKVFHDYLNGVIEGRMLRRVQNCIRMLKHSIQVWIQVFQMIKLCMKYTPMNMMDCVMD